MEGSIGIKVAKTGKNQNLKKKNMMLKTHQHVGGVIYEEIYQQKCQISTKKIQKDQKKEIDGEDNSPTCRRSDI